MGMMGEKTVQIHEDSIDQGKNKAETIHWYCPFSLHRFVEKCGFYLCSLPEKMDYSILD